MTDSTYDFYQILNSIASAKGSDTMTPSDAQDTYDWKNAYDEILSDFNSYRKRNEISRLTEKKNLTKEIIRGFLEIMDFVLYTYKAKNQMGTLTEEDEMVLNKLYSFLKQFDVKPMKNVDGYPFDPNFHEAILVDRSGMFEDGMVTMVINQGYMIGDEVLRHAKVCVSASPDE